MKTAAIDYRYPEAGFVIVNLKTRREKRMVFAPHRSNENEIILTTGNWGKLTTQEKMACRNALIDAFPDKNIILGD